MDEEGKRRASFGLLGAYPGQGTIAGVELFTAAGESCLSPVVDEEGTATISFASGGNEVLVLSTAGSGESVSGAPVVTMCRPDGDVAAQVTIDTDGSLHLQAPRRRLLDGD